MIPPEIRLPERGLGVAYQHSPFTKALMREARVNEVAQTILHYLRRNPDAQDTLEGINWWLPDQQSEPRQATIRQALDSLVAAGLISTHRGKDERISYRVTENGLRGP